MSIPGTITLTICSDCMGIVNVIVNYDKYNFTSTNLLHLQQLET